MENILLFLDLDDTIFQTKRKNIHGIIPATNPENPENTSFMTESQQLFIDIFLNMDNVKIIPVTARDLEQYERAFISKHHKVTTAIMYFGGLILDNAQIDKEWQKHILNSYAKLKISVSQVFEKLSNNLDTENFKIHSVEDFYLVIKNRSRNKEQYTVQNDELKNELLTIIEDEYYIHYNGNNISVIPEFLDKKYAVEYLIKKYQPKLTIGAGDSITDLTFMQVCDFKIIPQNSQIDKKLLSFPSIIPPLKGVRGMLRGARVSYFEI